MTSKGTLHDETLVILAGFLREVIGEDWIEEMNIEAGTSFSGDLELESIEFVALAEKLQGHYGDSVDFVGWLSGKEIDEIISLCVGDVVEFIVSCLSSKPTA
jgi:acyl carrier protein